MTDGTALKGNGLVPRNKLSTEKVKAIIVISVVALCLVLLLHRPVFCFGMSSEKMEREHNTVQRLVTQFAVGAVVKDDSVMVN